MNNCGQLIGLAALAMVGLTPPAPAQTEQWLQYHTGNESRGYRWLDLTTNAPADVALPKLGDQVFFARWTTPLDPQGRWICFGRTRKTGPHNRVFVDSNGNGRLDDDQPLDAQRVDQYSSTFDPARLVFQGEDGPFTYHLALRFMRYSANDSRLLAQAGCYYAGKVKLGSAQPLVTLVDANANGTFNDRAPNPSDCDAIIVEADESGQRYLGQLLELDGQFFAIEVAQDGAFLTVQPARDVVLAPVRVPEAISEITVVGGPGHFVRKPVKGEFTLPAGSYRVHGWTIERKDDKGTTWTLSGSGFGELARFEAKAGQTATLDVGEPVRAAMTVTENRGGAAFGLRLKGRLGETLEVLQAGKRPRPPQLELASVDGSFRVTSSFQYG